MNRHKGEPLINRTNWNETRTYLTYCTEVKQNSPGSIRVIESSLNTLLRWAQDRRLPYVQSLRPTYPQYLVDAGFSIAYTNKSLAIARQFFHWALEHVSYYRKLNSDWINSLCLNKTEDRVKEREIFTLEDVLALVNVTPMTLAEERDRAAVAFLFLSGMRGGAFTTMPVEAVHIDQQPIVVNQWPALGMHTKNGKSANTFLLPHPDLKLLEEIVISWHKQLTVALGPKGLWYAIVDGDRNCFAAQQVPGTNRGSNLGKRIKALCERAGVHPMSPHKLRHGHAVWALQHCETIEDLKAVSQNLMHSSLVTTDSIYGILRDQDVARRIAQLGVKKQQEIDTAELLAQLLAHLKNQTAGNETAEGDDLVS